MILTGSEIKRNVSLGRITIDPFNSNQVNPNSYNYRLGHTYIELENGCERNLNFSGENVEFKYFSEEGTILYPGKVYLASTNEIIGSDKYVTSLIGKSSMGRLGLFLQLSADLGHQGEIHKWTLEITCCKPTIVYPLMIIGQVTFWKTYGKKFESQGYYKKFDLPTVSRGVINDIDWP